jgi:hypothetical protein
MYVHGTYVYIQLDSSKYAHVYTMYIMAYTGIHLLVLVYAI